MSSTTLTGFLVILGVGIVILGIAALADRRNRRRGEGVLDTSPAHSADAGATPQYVTMSELLRRTPASPGKTAPRGTAVPLTLADQSLANADGRCVVADARVLVCDDPVRSMRELLGVWGYLGPAQALVVAAPSFDADVIDDMVANSRGGTHIVAALVGDADARAQLASLTGAVVVDRPDRQAGAVPDTALGRAQMLSAGRDDTLVS